SVRKAISEFSPNLVISDIRMPGLSGIQLLEEYPLETRAFKTVFVTAYGNFEYAKHALELGAFGYLLKPVEPDELKKTLKKIKTVLDIEKGVTEQICHYEKAKILYTLLDSFNKKDNIIEKLEKIGIKDHSRKYVLVLAESDNVISDQHLDMSKWDIVYFTLSHHRSLLFVQSKNGNLNSVGYKNLITYLSEVSEKEKIKFGISNIMSDIIKFRTAFNQAECALDTIFINGRNVNLYYDGDENIDEIIRFILEFRGADKNSLLLEKLPEMLVEKNINIDNFSSIVSCLVKHLGIETEDVEVNVKELINQFSDVKSYFSYLNQYRSGSYKPNGKTSSRYVIREITDYIDHNYNEKLMINDLAQKFFLNPSYLSGLFKEETGKPFTAYLVECRLNKAVELLENTDLSSSEISVQVGYEDYFHFSKLFKKHIGISPSNYRKSKRVDES
ncbi:MAG: helix-turn-helix domain-containing protein, partial [Clostridia bacterium]|nr:helix-turn-helix domain-containing protein [Clostridia bacterium]